MNIIKLRTILLTITGALLSYFMFDFSIISQVGIFFVFVFILMLNYQNKGILHPLSWYPIVFFLYSVSYPLYLYLYDDVSIYVYKIIPINFIALLSFIFSFLFFERNCSYNVSFCGFDSLLRLVGWFLIFFCNSLNVFVFLAGVSSKREFLNLVESYNMSSLFVSFFLLSLISALIVKNSIEKFNRIKLDYFLIASTITFFLVFGITGERDLLFRFGLLISLITFSFWLKYNVWKFCIGLILFVIILPITQQLKSFFMVSSVELEYDDGAYLNSEFASAGKNLLYLLERNVEQVGISIFINDIYRFFNFLGYTQMSGTAWFNEIVRHQYGDGGVSGWGFSLVAEGYIAFGLNGVIGLFIFLGAVTAMIYNSMQNRFMFSMYLLYVPVMIYVIRADLSNFLSLNFKVNFFIVGVLFFILYVVQYPIRKLKRFKK